MADVQRTQVSAAEALEQKTYKGFECRVCKCRDSYVLKTMPGNDFKRRVRVCRHCGTQRVTVEK